MSALSRRALLTAGGLGGAAAALSACHPGGGGGRPGSPVGHCFSASEHNGRLDGLRVFQQAPPPASDAVGASYPYWPCTDAATTQDLDRSTWTGGNLWAFVWANRCNNASAWNRKPNPLPAPREHVGRLECRAVFTSHARANAATRSQTRYLLGMAPDDYQEPWLRLPGTSASDFVTDADFRRQPGRHCRTNLSWRDETFRVMTDKVLLPASRLVDGANAEYRAGVMLDYEVQDRRHPDTTERFVQELAADLDGTGKKLFLFTNPFNAPTQQYTGCTEANLPRILAAVDHLGVFLWSQGPDGSIPASYDRQLEMLGPLTAQDHAKLVVNLELGEPGSTIADARWLHDVLRAGSGPDKVMFWRNHVTQGGSCGRITNQKISMVCFGE